MEDITDKDYAHPKRVCKDFEIKKFGEYHDLYHKKCLKIYKLDPAKFFSALGIAWQEALKKTKSNLDLLTDINMLLSLFINMEKLITNT